MNLETIMLAASLLVLGGAGAAATGHAEEQQSIPNWVKEVAGFWSQGLISDDQYAGTLSYLAAEGLIVVPAAEPEQKPTCDKLLDEMMLYGFASSSTMLPIVDNVDRMKVFKPLHDEYLETFRELKSMIDDAECHMTAKDSIIYTGINTSYKIIKNVYDDTLATGHASCVLFCDSSGYEPQWAKSMGENQAISKCTTLVANEYGTPDSNWCIEFSGYVLDQMN